MRPVRTWVLVADGRGARLFEALGPGKGLNELADAFESQDVPAGRELASDRPGRTFESVGARRSAIEPRTDPRRELKRSFAVYLAEELKSRQQRNEFDRLVLVAPPATLGDLRDALAPAVAALVVADLAKDLTRASSAEIRAALSDAIVI